MKGWFDLLLVQFNPKISTETGQQVQDDSAFYLIEEKLQLYKFILYTVDSLFLLLFFYEMSCCTTELVSIVHSCLE